MGWGEGIPSGGAAQGEGRGLDTALMQDPSPRSWAAQPQFGSCSPLRLALAKWKQV